MVPLVVIESPYRGDIHKNTVYARMCLLDSIKRGETPFMSHLLYTQVLDEKPENRDLGISMNLQVIEAAGKLAVYTDLGVSEGMSEAIVAAQSIHLPIEYREINPSFESDIFPNDSKQRKEYPLYRGLFQYFPRALAAVAHHSFIGNEQHHPGEPLHWDKTKSTDEPDALLRHVLEGDKVAVAWRALAWLERSYAE